MKQVQFTKEQIQAISEQFSSCVESAKIDGEFNVYVFYGAIQSFLDFLSKKGYIYLGRYDNVRKEK